MTRKRKNKVIKPKKASSYRKLDPITQDTPTGLKEDLVEGVGFTTYRELMVPYTASALMSHAKKSRSYIVLDGVLAVQRDGQQLRVGPGQKVDMNPGCVYRVATISDMPAEVMVVESAKYEARLKTIEEPVVTDQLPEKLAAMRAPKSAETPARPARSASKAVEQLRQIDRAMDKRRPGDSTSKPQSLSRATTKPDSMTRAATHIGVNPQIPIPTE